MKSTVTLSDPTHRIIDAVFEARLLGDITGAQADTAQALMLALAEAGAINVSIEVLG